MQTNKYTITNKRLDKVSGCCGMNEDTLETRRITDLAYRRCFPCCCCYGAIVIEQGSERPREIISTWHTHGAPSAPLPRGRRSTVLS